MNQDQTTIYKTILFRDYAKYTSLRDLMVWDEYGLVETPLPTFAIEKIRDKAVKLLCRNYGYYPVNVELIDNTGDYPNFCFPDFESDLMMYFPDLIQSLSITLKMLGMNVPEVDIIKETYNREEDIKSNQTNDNTNFSETDIINNNTSQQKSETDSTQTASGKVKDTGTSTTDIDYEREITNSSEVEETGNRTANVSHTMPEQALPDNGHFPKDKQGTPILTGSYIQSANENFNTMNPLKSVEKSKQKDIRNKQSTINDLEQDTTSLNDTFSKGKGESEEETKGKTSTNETLKNVVVGEGKNIIKEERITERTNPQYAQEISKFLDNVKTINAFEDFIDRFSWLIGIV